MAHHASAGIVPEHARNAPVGGLGAVADDDHTGVLRIAHADAAAMVQRNPGRTTGDVEHGVEQRPVADRIAAVLHRFGLAIGAGHAARIEMIATDHDRSLQFATAHHFVEGQAELVALAETDPADACRQALEADALARHVEPVVQVLIVGDQFLDLRIGLVDVLRITAQGHPAERADAAAEQRTHVGRHEPGEIEGILASFVEGHLADIVAVVEGRYALPLEGEHRLDMHAHRFLGRVAHLVGIALLFVEPLLDAPADRQIAVHGIMRAGLVGHRIGFDPAADQFGQDLGGIAEQRDRLGLPRFRVLGDPCQGVIEIGGLLVDIARAQAEVDAALLALDVERAGAGEAGRQRLGPAHAAEAGGQDPLALQIAGVVLAAHLDEGLVGALDDAL